MQKGTILYMGNFELPDKNAAAHRVVNNGKIFRKLGYNVVYLGTVRGASFDGVRVSDYDENIYEEAYPISTKAWVKHIFDTENIEAVARRFEDACLVITYNVPYATFKAVKKAFRNTAVKVAYDCTEWNSYAEGSLPKRLYKKLDEHQIRNRLPKKCRNMIVISSMMEKKYRGCNLLRLPPLIDLDDPIWRQERKVQPGVFEFCFAGTISNKERIDTVVRAFCEIDHSDIRLRIIGLSKEEYCQAYPEQSELVCKDDRLLFMGYVSHEESVQYVLSCDCYVFIRENTRRNEAGFPTKFAESFTCGVPIISTDVSDIRQYADDRVLMLEDTSLDTVKNGMRTAVRMQKNRTVNPSNTFDYHHYISETEEWISRIR